VKQLSSESLDIVAQVAGAFGCFIAVVALYSDWRLLLAWIGMMVVMSFIAPLQAAMITGEDAVETAKKQGKENTNKIAVATTTANQIVGDCTVGIRTVASFNLEQRFFDGFAKSTSQIAGYQKSDAVKKGFFQGLTYLIMFATIGAIFYLGVYLVNEKLVTFTDFMAPLWAVTGLMVPMMSMGALSDIKGASNAAIRLFALFDRVPEIDSLSEKGGKLESIVGEIEVKDVVFSYPTAPDTLVCKGYSLSIAAGQTVALCGPSGSGKSTIINLIERFYDPSSGTISLDGVDIKTLNVKWLRSQLGLVSQEPVLFQGTVSQNIAYGASADTAASQDDIIEAAKMANAHEFITTNLGDGYNTDVGLKGGKLSGGQKQRVAIARAIVKRPKVLLLDEATSALDNESERIVQAALDEIMAKQKRTTIVIAHRLSTIRNADKIAVVSEGAILEEGTHDELLGMQGMYTKLIITA
jgi:ATP-binding cassette subfamily B (MDR/TAP) protein 1